jgi:gamma-glutamyltranspeptidase/glutathione hydrolase
MFEDYRPGRFGPGRSAVICQNGVVATSQPLAAQAGLQILRDGGNAIDAAVATAAMLNVVEPMSTGIGGDAFMLVYRPQDGRLRGLNASGRSPYAAELEFFRKKGLRSMPERGSLYPVTVPGTVDGWAVLLEACGRMSLKDVLAPAIHHAEKGFPVSPRIGDGWSSAVDLLSQSPDAAATYLVDGRAPRVGEVFLQPNLARTLRMIADGGRDAFYRGEIAERIVRYSEENGGLFTLKDFADHTSTWVEPISTDYRGYTVHEIPPNGQGIAALLALNIAAGFDLKGMGHGSAEALHCQIEAMRLGFSDLYQHVTDPDLEDVPVKTLLSEMHTRNQRARLDQERARPDPPAAELPSGDDTVYLTVVDRDRNVVSFINSLYLGFGSGLVAGDTGIALQNRGAGFSLDPEHVNRIAPHKRTLHTIIPGMITWKDKPLVSFGVMGGQMQPQGHFQFVSNLVDFDMDVQSALEAPRFRIEEDHLLLALEPGFSPSVGEALARRGHGLSTTPTSFGGGQAIFIHPEYDTLIAGSEPRKDGCAAGY